MSLPVQTSPVSNGMIRSAALMKALGARGNSVWSNLSTQEAARLSAAMQALPEDPTLEEGAARAFLGARQASEAGGRRRDPPVEDAVWERLSALDGAAMAHAIASESPQIVAVVLANLSPQAAAGVLRALPSGLASDALQRLLTLGEVRPEALRAIEVSLLCRLEDRRTTLPGRGHEHLARIFDSLDGKAEAKLLSALDKAEPGASEKIRALMFTFEDLATLGPASVQTILAHIERRVLILALKGAPAQTAETIFANMTQRAADLLRTEIESLGPVRRSEIDAARGEILTLARTLVRRGDILASEEADELIE